MYRAIAAFCVAAGLFLALHHPIAPGFAAAWFCLWAGIAWRWPQAWLVAVPASLPMLDLLPWTGWVAFDEFDILLLATAAGSNFRLGRSGLRRPRMGALVGLWLALSVPWGIALLRGIGDAGGWQFDWFGGYRDMVNSLRVGKSLVLMTLLAPPLADAFGRDAKRAGGAVALGMAIGLALVAAAVIRERAIYPGLLDFSTPYRPVAAFWEMHVGGAALDGYLALTIPFSAWAILEADRRWRWLAAAALAVAVGYACLTTFSRGLYLAVTIELLVLAWLRLWPRRSGAASDTGFPSVRARTMLSLGFLGLAQLAFVGGGYAGALSLMAIVVLAMLANGLLGHRWWAIRWRTLGGTVVAMALIIETVAIVNGGSFLAERLAQGNQDFASRLAHWRKGLAILHDPWDWLFGKGLGRLPAGYVHADARHELPADFSFRQVGDNGLVWLAGPASEESLAGLFGISQMVPVSEAADRVVGIDVEAFAAGELDVSLCAKHLLYESSCATGHLAVPAASGWQHFEVPLAGSWPAGRAWYSPRWDMFTISVSATGRTVAIDNVRLTADGRQLLANGEFSQGLARWFLGGGGYYLPWHIDNLILEVLIELGLCGLLALSLFVVATLRVLVSGAGRCRGLAPFFAAALAGFLVTGTFASLIEVPRVACLFFLLAAAAWHLPGGKGINIPQGRLNRPATMG